MTDDVKAMVAVLCAAAIITGASWLWWIGIPALKMRGIMQDSRKLLARIHEERMERVRNRKPSNG